MTPPGEKYHVHHLRKYKALSSAVRFGPNGQDNDEFNHREWLAKNAKTSAWCEPMTVP
jgi:hypothetical protein